MCTKVAFDTVEIAQKRAGQIIKEERRETGKNFFMRPYKCPDCGMWHLTTMSSHNHKMKNDTAYKNKVNETNFIKQQSEHWEEYYNKLK